MPLPADIQVALSLLQILGLLIPVVFVVLQPLLAPGESVAEEKQEATIVSGIGMSEASMEVVRTPTLIHGGIAVITCLALAAIAVSIRLTQFVWGSWFITAGVGLLMVGVVGLVVMVYLIRREFVSEVPGV